MTIPVNAIDPQAAYREWEHQYEWHLGLVPAVVEMLITLAAPTVGVSRGGSRFDRPQITGGGYYEDLDVSDAGTGPLADARDLWAMLHEYTTAVGEWIEPLRPSPGLPDALPATAAAARDTALVTVGWLIDHAARIEPLHELDEYRDQMFYTIRRLRRVHGIHRRPRQDRRRMCTTCGERAVVVDWVTPADGSPRPVKVGVCKSCGEQYTETESPSPDQADGGTP